MTEVWLTADGTVSMRGEKLNRLFDGFECVGSGTSPVRYEARRMSESPK